jgi:F-type H+-transporting ATPase subunit beta
LLVLEVDSSPVPFLEQALLDSLQLLQEQRRIIGTIVEVHGPVVIIDCTQLPPLRQALCTYFDHTAYLFEVHQHLDERHIRAPCMALPD